MKRIAVIGAGAAGLAAIRALTRMPYGFHVVAYEQSDRVGGTWIHNDKYKATSMYDNLRTNLPKEVMAFPEYPFPDCLEQSFIGHKDVLTYLENFAEHFKLKQYIQFFTTVKTVDIMSKAEEDDLWDVTYEKNGIRKSEQFNAVIVCNGHYTDPVIPEIDGTTNFNGEILHSHSYRSPSVYADKTVLVLGAGPSGADIALDLTQYAKQIYLSHNKKRLQSILPSNVEQVAGLKSLNQSSAVLNDGEEVPVDVVIFATGYEYTFPFLSSQCHPIVKNHRVVSTYKMLVDMKYHSMFYIGLNMAIVPFPQFYIQAEYVSAVLRGDLVLPSKQEMISDNENMFRALVTNLNRPERHFHFLRDYQWIYNDDLARECGISLLDRCVPKLYDYTATLRSTQLSVYKNKRFRFTSCNNFVTIDD